MRLVNKVLQNLPKQKGLLQKTLANKVLQNLGKQKSLLQKKSQHKKRLQLKRNQRRMASSTFKLRRLLRDQEHLTNWTLKRRKQLLL